MKHELYTWLKSEQESAEYDQFIEALEDRQSRLELKKLMQDMISNFPQYRIAWEIDDSIELEPK